MWPEGVPTSASVQEILYWQVRLIFILWNNYLLHGKHFLS
jgi:hypothetical protein